MINFLLIFVLLYLAAMAYLYFNQRSFMYFPDRTAPNLLDYKLQGSVVAKITTPDGLALQGWYFPPTQMSAPVIVYFHGNGGHYANRYYKVLPYLQVGYGVLLAEYRGYGGNPGFPSEQGFYTDARAWMDFLKQKNISLQNTILYGESIGSGVATQMATEYRTRALILEAPFTSAAAVGQRVYFYMPVTYLIKDSYDNLGKIASVKMPVLIIHGDNDTTIPVLFGKALYEEAREPKKFIAVEKAGHNDLYDYGAALSVMEFLATLGEQASSYHPSAPDPGSSVP